MKLRQLECPVKNEVLVCFGVVAVSVDFVDIVVQVEILPAQRTRKRKLFNYVTRIDFREDLPQLENVFVDLFGVVVLFPHNVFLDLLVFDSMMYDGKQLP